MSEPTRSVRSALVGMAILGLGISLGVAQRRPPEIGRHLPTPAPSRIEVRFAVGDKAVRCAHFHMTAKAMGRVILDGRFTSGFEIPTNATNLPRKDALELEFKCRKHRWHFTHVGERAFLRGWWWVGTDRPPFQEAFQTPEFSDALWIRYLIVDPSLESGFTVYNVCPVRLKDQKPGPCFEH